MYDLIRKIQFKRPRLNQFQQKLKKDINEVEKSDKVFVPADKTPNVYKLDSSMYKKLLAENITSTYKKAESSTKDFIDLEAKQIAQEHKIADRVEAYACREAFITLKDHKENFLSNPKCRLLNPAKSEIGLISKQLLESIIATVRNRTKANQWRNTNGVLKWFNGLRRTRGSKFLQFDVVEFYPSIMEDLLEKAIIFAKNFADISDRAYRTIMHARKSLLFNGEETWVKKANPLFDVTMGSYDGAEICELVGLFLLHEIKQKLKNKVEVGLYRDDGLGVTPSMSGPERERLNKDIIHIFKSHGLRITIQANLDQVDFLDVTLDLRNGKFWPFSKPNSTPLYIHKDSNHPPCITKQLPSMIEERISALSCDKVEFDRAKEVYEGALARSGFTKTMQYTEKSTKPRQRKRNITWFNPPFNAMVKTNVGRAFLNLLNRHFSNEHRFHKIFNRNTVKLSYSCMPSVERLLSKHNKGILSKRRRQNQPAMSCNCRIASQCPLSGSCLESAIIYQANVTSSQGTKIYIGSTETTFKQRYGNHKQSLEKRAKSTQTSLSKYVWDLKDQQVEHTISWQIVKRSSPYKCGARSCDLCLSEKFFILTADPLVCINRNSDLLQKCRHRNKFKLCNLAPPGSVSLE